MEPTLNDIEDYNKPLSDKKFETIAIAAIVTIALYLGVVHLTELLG